MKLIKAYYNGEEYIFKEWEGEENYVLYDETNFGSSVRSVNGKFKQSGWGGTSWTATAYDTTNKRIYSTGIHSKAGLSFTEAAYDEIGNAKKVKIIYDYLYVSNNTNRYASGFFIFLRGCEKNSSGMNIYGSGTYTLSSGTEITHSVEYKGELIYDLVNDSGTFTFTDISSQAETVYNVTGCKQYWVKDGTNKSLFLGNMEADSGTMLGGQIRDQGTTSYFGDMHVYVVL